MKRAASKFLFFLALVCSLSLILQRCEPPRPYQPPQEKLTLGWQKIIVDTTKSFADIWFVNTGTGFLCGNNYISKSTDGGLSWTSYNLPDSLSGNYSDLFFVDENTGWAVSSHRLLRTTNGGTTWLKTDFSDQIRDVQFPTPTVGFLASSGGPYKSLDGGVSWHKIDGSVTDLTGLFFFDKDTGWVSGSMYIEATHNGALSHYKRTSLPAGNYNKIQFTDENHGWTTGSPDIRSYIGLWRTTNSGNSWEMVLELYGGGDFHFFNNNEGYISSGESAISLTTNGGKNLTLVVAGLDKIGEIHFTDPNHGWAASKGYIFRYSR